MGEQLLVCKDLKKELISIVANATIASDHQIEEFKKLLANTQLSEVVLMSKKKYQRIRIKSLIKLNHLKSIKQISKNEYKQQFQHSLLNRWESTLEFEGFGVEIKDKIHKNCFYAKFPIGNTIKYFTVMGSSELTLADVQIALEQGYIFLST